MVFSFLSPELLWQYITVILVSISLVFALLPQCCEVLVEVDLEVVFELREVR